ncbi:hypothetical protein BJ912DRAFT_1059875 [Pholiota molesta]|nr:hypothetical protein BJ912DRAFT_1059875 [Pholiota molesta]
MAGSRAHALSRTVRQVPASEADTSRAHHIDSTPGGGPRLPPTSYRCHESNRQVPASEADTSRAHHIDSTPGGGPRLPPTSYSTLRIDSNEKNFVIPTGAHQRGGHEPGTPHRLDSGWWSPSPHLLPPHIAGATACVPPGKAPIDVLQTVGHFTCAPNATWYAPVHAAAAAIDDDVDNFQRAMVAWFSLFIARCVIDDLGLGAW